jgi:hypothetical protein
MGTNSSSVDDALWNSFVVKTLDFLPSDLILKQRGAAVLSVRYFKPLDIIYFRIKDARP